MYEYRPLRSVGWAFRRRTASVGSSAPVDALSFVGACYGSSFDLRRSIYFCTYCRCRGALFGSFRGVGGQLLGPGVRIIFGIWRPIQDVSRHLCWRLQADEKAEDRKTQQKSEGEQEKD